MFSYFQSVANLLGLTKSEATGLLSALGQNQANPETVSPRHHIHSGAPLSITAFLGCFEFASSDNVSKAAQDVRMDDRPGSSRVGSVNPVAVRKGLSNEMTIQLGKFMTVSVLRQNK